MVTVTQSYKLKESQGGFDIDSPPNHAFAVTPHDTNQLNNPTTGDDVYIRAFRVGTTAGDVKVTMRGGDETVIPNVQIGETVVGLFKIIWSTGTGAAGITGFY